MHNRFYIAQQLIMFLNTLLVSFWGNIDLLTDHGAIIIVQLQGIRQQQVKQNVTTVYFKRFLVVPYRDKFMIFGGK